MSKEMAALMLALAMARVLAGETPGCEIEAKIGVMNVMQNRTAAGIEGGWFGDAAPTGADVAVAWLGVQGLLPRLAASEIYAIGPGDKAKMAWLWGRSPTMRWVCRGTFIEIYDGP